MNSAGQHLEKARQNLAFLDSIDLSQAGSPDWAIVVLFYASLHLVSAYVYFTGSDHGRSHAERFRRVEPLVSTQAFDAYRTLYNRSRLARYETSVNRVEYEALLNSAFNPLEAELRQRAPELFARP